jgi:hypothetical protein
LEAPREFGADENSDALDRSVEEMAKLSTKKKLGPKMTKPHREVGLCFLRLASPAGFYPNNIGGIGQAR